MDVLRHFAPCASVGSLVLGAQHLLLFRIWKGWLPFATESCGGLGYVVILLHCHCLPAAVMCWSIVRLKLCAIGFVMHLTVTLDRDRGLTDTKRRVEFGSVEYQSGWRRAYKVLADYYTLSVSVFDILVYALGQLG